MLKTLRSNFKDSEWRDNKKIKKLTSSTKKSKSLMTNSIPLRRNSTSKTSWSTK